MSSTAVSYPDPKAAASYLAKAEEETYKIPGIPEDLPMPKIEKVGVIGAGTMGGGIAMCYANAGIPVVIVEADAAALKRGLEVIRRNYENTAKKGRITAEDVQKRMSLLTGSMDYSALSDCDVITEAIYENLKVKQEVFRKIAAVSKPTALLGSNTSALDIDEIATAVPAERRGGVLGMHFFAPANVMRMLEIVQGRETSREVLAASMAISKKIQKVPVLAGVCYGFVGNRILYQRQREANRLVLEEGVMPWDVDKVLLGFGFPMGPFQMSDLSGLDIGWSKETSASRDIRERLCEMDRRGQKTNAGYYDYDESRRAIPSKVTEKVIEDFRKEKGYTASNKLSETEILERLLFPMINEGAEILDQGKVLRSSDIDICYVYGYGFPRAKGGLMYFADHVGLQRVYNKMKELESKYGPELKPAALLEKLARENKKFGDLPPNAQINTGKVDTRVRARM
ncbi:peroxisomal bifunctional enzyme [Hyaloraphidium curvatum]|nr:peroxisomal bifunctional enzyme [Hyaloraphidium curvatum]